MQPLARRDAPGKKVIIIGAGMAGLVAGYELARAGHEPLILEAQNRVGGRSTRSGSSRRGCTQRPGRCGSHASTTSRSATSTTSGSSSGRS